ncbi:ROK family glucokinase [Bacillus massilinigeriensis]|uniref:ROK family glucokinase n=1 Tax=Bacillus massilionigeriensis TaxID=1805475 RepID=UPI00096B10D3|nr:ROK family glucokinase [Bacillus massilionigeriensis]
MSEKWLIGVDLGGTTTKLAFLNQNGDIIHKWEIPTDNTDEGKNITTNIDKAIEEKLAELNDTKENVLGIGMGAPGPVDYEKGIIYKTVNLSWHENYPLKDLLQEVTGLPVAIENDANCAAAGEMWKGAGSGSQNVLFVTLGTGVGGGIVANGKILQGSRGAGGEIGHLVSVPEGGALCGCGKTGCLETVASATGIVRIATEELKSKRIISGSLYDIFQSNGVITAKDVFDCANNGDEKALSVVDQISHYLGLALANIASTVNPEKIVLGGGVSRAGDVLLKPVQHYFKKYVFPPIKDYTTITLATLGNDAGVIGAAWLIKDHIQQQ